MLTFPYLLCKVSDFHQVKSGLVCDANKEEAAHFMPGGLFRLFPF
jgi:hypothetical protein